MKTLLKTILPLLLICRVASAQVFYSGGATVTVGNGGILFVNGGAEFTGGSTLENHGQITTTNNSTLPGAGNFVLGGASSAGGNGSYHVEQDWINSATFNAGNSTVELFGNTIQQITSFNNTPTTFHHLLLTGSGTGNNRKKQLLNVDARTGIGGVLTLNNRELVTGTNIFYVDDPSPSSVTNNAAPGNEGFVSSTGGYLSRVTNSSSAYLFPVGSSAGTLRYRPLAVKPADAAVNTFRARLNNYDATTDGFNINQTGIDVCTVNPLFYHSLFRTSGSSPADVTLSFSPAADGNWAHMARWATVPGEWSSMDPPVTGTLGSLATITRTSWNFSDNAPGYALSKARPLPPQLSCPAFCEQSLNNIFTAIGAPAGYLWTVPPMATLVSGQGTGSILVNWITGTGPVSVVAVGDPGCNSLPANCIPVVYPLPDARFNAITPHSPYSLDYTFADASSGAGQWNWNFGDGNISSEMSPAHRFRTIGDYLVKLKVTSGQGCTDETSQWISIKKYNVNVPNSFTPNGDGRNDLFRPLSAPGMPLVPGVSLLQFHIFDRWGEAVYVAGSNNNAGWDGKRNGKDCPVGAYVYRIKYKDLTTGLIQELSGQVTLIR